MNCSETQAWMLHSETPAIAPAPASEHLSRCGQCRGIYQQLLTVETHLQSAPLPAVPAHVRQAIFAGMGPAPVRVVPVKVATVRAVEPASIKPRITIRRRHRSRSDHLIGYLIAAAASIVIGLIIGYSFGLGGRDNPLGTTIADGQRGKPEVPVEKMVGPKEAVAVETPRKTNVVPTVVPEPEVEVPDAIAQTPETPLPPEAPDENTSPLVPPGPKVAAVPVTKYLNDDELLAQLIANHTEVTAANTPGERLTQLDAMAKVLWTQAVKHSEMGGTDRLKLMQDAYTGIVEIDLPAIAREMPADQQEIATVVTGLKERAAESADLKASAPASMARIFEQLSVASDSSVQRLERKSKEPFVRPKTDNNQNNLLPIVIEQTVWAAREENPLERADHSTVVAEALANDIVVTAFQGNGTRASQLGGHYGRILEDGVAVNLQRIDLSKATYQQSRRYQQVLARTQQTAILLQKSLNTAKPDARVAFEEALRAGGLPVPPRPMVSAPPIIIFRWTPGRFGHHHGR